MNNQFPSLEEQIVKAMSECSFIPFTRSSRLFSTVRRMKAERELHVPINRRADFVISTENGLRPNEMTEGEWQKFFEVQSNELKTDYPDLYNQLFARGENYCDRCGVKAKNHLCNHDPNPQRESKNCVRSGKRKPS